MNTKLSKISAPIIAGLMCASLSLVSPTFAENSICNEENVPPEVKAASGCSGTTTELPDYVQTVLYTIISVLGIVAVIYIIIGGVSYMTSTGDPQKTQKARKTILYAVIGLVICVLAFAIVNFVIDKI